MLVYTLGGMFLIMCYWFWQVTLWLLHVVSCSRSCNTEQSWCKRKWDFEFQCSGSVVGYHASLTHWRSRVLGLGLNTFLIPPKWRLCWIRADTTNTWMYRQYTMQLKTVLLRGCGRRTCFCLLTSKALWDLGLSWVHSFFGHMCHESNLATLTALARPL